MKFNVAQLLKGSSGASLSYDLDEAITWIGDDLDILAPLVLASALAARRRDHG